MFRVGAALASGGKRNLPTSGGSGKDFFFHLVCSDIGSVLEEGSFRMLERSFDCPTPCMVRGMGE